MMPEPMVAALLVLVALCVGVDLRARRIPNLISGLGMLLGLVSNTLYFGAEGLMASVGGLLLMVALLLLPFALGGLGGGDVKMMGAIGAFLGPRAACAALLLGMVFGGVVMAVHLARRGRLRHTVMTVGTMATASLLGASLEPLRVSTARPGAIALPYSVPLGLGTIAVQAISRTVGL